MSGAVMNSPSTNDQFFRTLQEWFESNNRGMVLLEAKIELHIRGCSEPWKFVISPGAISSVRPQSEPEPPANGSGLSECAADILSIVREVGHRLTTNEIFNELSQREKLHGDSTVRTTLARMVREKVITNKPDSRPKGYGLPEFP